MFTVQKIFPNTFELLTTSNSLSFNSTLRLTPEKGNFVTIQLSTSIPVEHSPIERIKTLIRSSKLRGSYKAILSSLSKHFTSIKSLYDIDIIESNVSFEYVATLSKSFSQNPSIEEIYFMIDQVKGFVKEKGGIEKGFPMLHTQIGRASCRERV